MLSIKKANGELTSAVALLREPPSFYENRDFLGFWSSVLLDEAAARRKNTTNSHFEKISSCERLSSREKSVQNVTHTVSGNEPKCITKIAEKNLAICQKMA
jgi:hypothetical protein